MKRVFTILCLAFIIISTNGYAAPFGASSSNYDVVYHRISISVDPSSGSGAISNGSVTTYFRTTAAGVSTLQFDIDASNLTVSSATYHGTSITKSQSSPADILTLTLPSAIAAIGTLDSVTVYYSGTPAVPTTSIPSGYNVVTHAAGQYAIFTLDEAFTAHYWWPCKESLYDKVDSVDFIVTAPSAYRVASNGVLISEVTSGTNHITTWKTRYKIATYGINFALANYQLYTYTITSALSGKTFPVNNYLYPEDNTTAFHNYADQLTNIISKFENKLNVPYPFSDEQYGLAECSGTRTTSPNTADNWGALEVQSMTFICKTSYSDNGYTIAHEAAHQWFGDMVTTNLWNHVWLNEGFAQYFQNFIYPETVRTADIATRRTSSKSAVTTTSTVNVPTTSSADAIFIPSGSVAQPYEKGAMLLSMLRAWVGDAGFFAGLHDYLTAPTVSYNFGAVDSLKKYMQTYTPVDLTGFFNDWVNKQGYSNYTVQWYNVGKRIYFSLQQTPTVAGSTHFDMPVPVRITGTGLDTTVVLIDRGGVLYNSATGATTGFNKIAFNLSATPTAITVDPNNVILGTGSKAILTTLPVSDISLQATKNNKQVTIEWAVNTSDEIKQIELEKSYDGQTFTFFKNCPLSTLKGSTIDLFTSDIQYYRLKLADQNGKLSFSKIQAVTNAGSGKIEVVPNPAGNEVTMLLPEGFVNKDFDLIIRNSTGQLVKQLHSSANNAGKVNVQVNQLTPGMYWITLVNNKNEYGEVSFMKQ